MAKKYISRKDLIKMYADDYLGEDIKKLYELCFKFVLYMNNGLFEWDIATTDNLLWEIKNTINSIDI